MNIIKSVENAKQQIKGTAKKAVLVTAMVGAICGALESCQGTMKQHRAAIGAQKAEIESYNNFVSKGRGMTGLPYTITVSGEGNQTYTVNDFLERKGPSRSDRVEQTKIDKIDSDGTLIESYIIGDDGYKVTLTRANGTSSEIFMAYAPQVFEEIKQVLDKAALIKEENNNKPIR